MNKRIAIGLVHYPVVDRLGKTVATNVTNYDIHDIARASQVFGVSHYYIITPMREQLMFVSRILDHWKTGHGARYNPMRRTALAPVKTAESIEQAMQDWNPNAKLIGTSAREVGVEKSISFTDLRQKLQTNDETAYFLIFGTGFGLHNSVVDACHRILEPIRGAPPEDYRHLSVRSAVSICLDRLLGTW